MATKKNSADNSPEKNDFDEIAEVESVETADPTTLEKRSDDHTASLRYSKELPRHEGAVREAGLEVEDQHDVFEYQVVVMPKRLGTTRRGRDETTDVAEADPGPDNAAVMAAINAGYRPTGEATLHGPEDHPDGENVVFTWKVPVLKVKGPTTDLEGNKLPDNTTVKERHDDAAKTPAENKAEADAEARTRQSAKKSR